MFQAAYKSSRNKILLYHLARNYDSYYKNKKTDLLYYEKYLATYDSANNNYQEYSKYMVSELQKIFHFEIDSLE